MTSSWVHALHDCHSVQHCFAEACPTQCSFSKAQQHAKQVGAAGRSIRTEMKGLGAGVWYQCHPCLLEGLNQALLAPPECLQWDGHEDCGGQAVADSPQLVSGSAACRVLHVVLQHPHPCRQVTKPTC